MRTVAGLLELLRLAALTRCRFRGAYWRWRMETALGPGPAPARGERVRRVLEYARWVSRMRRP
jgi:hypothetical protein